MAQTEIQYELKSNQLFLCHACFLEHQANSPELLPIIPSADTYPCGTALVQITVHYPGGCQHTDISEHCNAIETDCTQLSTWCLELVGE